MSSVVVFGLVGLRLVVVSVFVIEEFLGVVWVVVMVVVKGWGLMGLVLFLGVC